MLDLSGHTLWDELEGILLVAAFLGIGVWANRKGDTGQTPAEPICNDRGSTPHLTGLPVTLTRGARMTSVTLLGIWLAVASFGAIFFAKSFLSAVPRGDVISIVGSLLLFFVVAIEWCRAVWIQLRLLRGDHLDVNFPTARN